MRAYSRLKFKVSHYPREFPLDSLPEYSYAFSQPIPRFQEGRELVKIYKVFASLLITFAVFSVQAWAADPPPAPDKMPAILASLDAGKVTVLDDKAAGAIRGQAYQYVLVRTVLN